MGGCCIQSTVFVFTIIVISSASSTFPDGEVRPFGCILTDKVV